MRVDDYGRVIADSETLCQLLLNDIELNDNILAEKDQLIDQYNELCSKFNKDSFKLKQDFKPDHSVLDEHKRRNNNWNLPPEFKLLDVRQFLLSLCDNNEQWDRVNMEMDMFEERQLIPLLQLMIFLVDYFRKNSIIWGVGRGSSVASYCLYLIGVHKIDALKYGLDIHEFLK